MNLRVILSLAMMAFINGFVFQSNDSSISIIAEERSVIPLEGGTWFSDSSGNSRTIKDNDISFSAYIIDDKIEIINTEPYYDLIISISNTQSGEIVYSEKISKESTNCMIISLQSLLPAEYCINISNSTAGFVYGYFNL